MSRKRSSSSTVVPSRLNDQFHDAAIETLSTNVSLVLKASYSGPRFQLGHCTSRYIQLSPSQPSTANKSQPIMGASLPQSLPGPMSLEGKVYSLPLAQAAPERGRGPRSYSVTLLGSSVGGGLQQRQSKSKWSFALPICADGETVTFEWRRSRGSEVKRLGASSRGWKLVRTGSVCCSQYDTMQDRDHHCPGTKNDREEHVVAVWAKKSNWTGLDFGTFALIGRVGENELSHRLAIMAVVSALCISQTD